MGDTLHKLRNGLDVKKHLKVTFVGEPAVDAGGPLREFFHRLLWELSQDNSLLCGPQNARVPRHSVIELERKTFFHVGVILALSLLHGGPAPQFFSSAVADYITIGIEGVKSTMEDVPEYNIRKSLEKVIEKKLHGTYIISDMFISFVVERCWERRRFSQPTL